MTKHAETPNYSQQVQRNCGARNSVLATSRSLEKEKNSGIRIEGVLLEDLKDMWITEGIKQGKLSEQERIVGIAEYLIKNVKKYTKDKEQIFAWKIALKELISKIKEKTK